MKTLLVRFRAFLVGLAPFVLSFLVISNFIVSCSVYRSSHPQFVYSHSVVTNYLYSVVTNYSSVSFPSPSAETVSIAAPSRQLPKTFDYPYTYSIVSGKSVAFLFGRYVKEGDTTSHGIILRIFPERIFLLTGDIIKNSALSNSSVVLPNKESTKNDRRTVY